MFWFFAAGFTALYGLLSTEASVWLEGRPLRLRSTAATLAYSGLRSVLRALRHYRALPPRAAFAILSVPVLSQMLGALVYFLTARALGQHVPVLSWVWILSLVQILQWVPASVSGLGLREGALVLLLPRYGVPPADALVFSIVVFGYTVVIGLLGGVFEARELIWKAAKEDVKPAGIRR